MKILLDQSAPRNLARVLAKHEFAHTAQLGWEEVTNGKLLKLAEENGYNLLITADQSIPYYNVMAGRLIGILALSTNNWNLMKPHVEAIVQSVEQVKPGEVMNLLVGKFVPSKHRHALEP